MLQSWRLLAALGYSVLSAGFSACSTHLDSPCLQPGQLSWTGRGSSRHWNLFIVQQIRIIQQHFPPLNLQWYSNYYMNSWSNPSTKWMLFPKPVVTLQFWNTSNLTCLQLQKVTCNSNCWMKECKNDYINVWFLVNLAFKKAVNFLIHSRKIQKKHKLLNRVDVQFLHLCFMNSSLFIYKCIVLHFMNTFIISHKILSLH